tara:strand:+ start:175260 stop:175439 length:180 start_codon:yes stop_codon:yes gene_type:complete
MEATKITLKIELECLSMDTIRGLLLSAVDDMDKERINGSFSHDDGDNIKWELKTEKVRI